MFRIVLLLYKKGTESRSSLFSLETEVQDIRQKPYQLHCGIWFVVWKCLPNQTKEMLVELKNLWSCLSHHSILSWAWKILLVSGIKYEQEIYMRKRYCLFCNNSVFGTLREWEIFLLRLLQLRKLMINYEWFPEKCPIRPLAQGHLGRRTWCSLSILLKLYPYVDSAKLMGPER